MPARTQNPDLVVIGGGVIGLAVAWRARERGLGVTLLERELAGGGTSRVAAGMLAPVSEVEFGEAGGRMLELGWRSAALWPGFAAELETAAHEQVGLLRAGTLMVARDADEARELERQIAFRASLGLRATRVRASHARELEPALAPTIRLALELPDDHSVDPRRLLASLRGVCLSAGVELREHARSRGWDHLRLLSCGDSTFKYDLGSEDAEGGQESTVSVFTLDADGQIRHVYTGHPRTAEDVYERGIDQLCAVWNVLDLTPQGRGDWYSSLSYD